MKSIIFAVIVGILLEICVGDPCNSFNVCEVCNAQAGNCTWCATGSSAGECFSTSSGVSNCTSLSGVWNGTCTTCSSAPTQDWCLVPGSNVLTSLDSSCVTTNTNGMSFNGTDNCSAAIELDGGECFTALYSLACSTYCGPCSPLTYNPSTPPKPCKDICDNLPFRCITAYTKGCLTSYMAQCASTNENCFNVSADPAKFGVTVTTGAGTTTGRVTTGTTGTTGNHLSTTGIQPVLNETASNSAWAIAPSSLFLVFSVAVPLWVVRTTSCPIQ